MKTKDPVKVYVNWAGAIRNEPATVISFPEKGVVEVRFDSPSKETSKYLDTIAPFDNGLGTYRFADETVTRIPQRICPKCDRSLSETLFADYLCRDCR